MTGALTLRIATTASDVLRAAGAELVLASVVCAIVWLVCRALGPRWPDLQQALWALVLLRLVLPPGLGQPYSLGALLDRLGLDYRWDEAGDAATVWLPVGRASGGAPAVPAQPALPLSRTLPILLVWAMGAAGLLWRDARQGRRYRRILREASSIEDARVLDLCEDWRRRLAIRRRVRLVTSDARMAPFTAGLVRPVVFLPSAVLGQAEGCALATALGHELGHVARLDSLWMRVQRAVQRLYFFHPAVWLAAHRLRVGRERLCDSLVVGRGLVAAPEYARGLLDVLELRLRPVSAPALTPTQWRIAMRVRAVLATSTHRRSRPLLALAVAAVAGGFLLPLASADVAGVPTPVAAATDQGAEIEPAEPDASESSTLQWTHGLANPLPGGRLRSAFGNRPDPTTGHTVFHVGLDLSAPMGAPVLAPADGRVSLAELKGGYGNALVIDHAGDVVTRYAHLQRFNVRVGQRVHRGDVIAFVGETGRSMGGPHLHYEVWIRNEARNPLQ